MWTINTAAELGREQGHSAGTCHGMLQFPSWVAALYKIDHFSAFASLERAQKNGHQVCPTVWRGGIWWSEDYRFIFLSSSEDDRQKEL